MSRANDHRQYKVLFVDDEAPSRECFAEVFGQDFSILVAPDAAAASKIVEQQRDEIAVLITDQRLSGRTGVDLLSSVKLHHPKIIRILTTADTDLATAIAAVNEGGIFRYVKKPWDLGELKETLLHALEMHVVRRNRDRLLAGKLRALQRLIVMDRVRGLAALSAAMSCRLRNTAGALRDYIRQSPLERWNEVNIDRAARMDFSKLARTEGENLVNAVQEVLWATLPWGVETWRSELERYHRDVDIQQVAVAVVERKRLAGDHGNISLDIDMVPQLPLAKANIDLMHHLFEILIGRLRAISGDDAPISIRVTQKNEHADMPQILMRFSVEAPDWTPDDLLPLFSAVIPREDLNAGLHNDILPAFLLTHHHAGSLSICSSGSTGPGFEVMLRIDPESQPEQELTAEWFDEVFSVLEQWDEFEAV